VSLHEYLRLFITMCVLASILASLGVFNATSRISDHTTLSYKCPIIEDYEVEFVLNKPSSDDHNYENYDYNDECK
jgi:hypothetical protein